MKRHQVAVPTFVALFLAHASTRLVRRYVVEGRSMLRAFAPGDRLLVEGLSYRLRPPRVGEVMVISRLADATRLDIKRVAAGPSSTVMVGAEERVLVPDEWYVLGDNLSESQDSRKLGPVRTKDVVGRVWLKY